MLRHILRSLRENDLGQDLAEYCLITALVALVALAIFCRVSGGIGNLWGVANTRLGSGNAAASTTTPSPSGAAQH